MSTKVMLDASEVVGVPNAVNVSLPVVDPLDRVEAPNPPQQDPVSPPTQEASPDKEATKTEESAKDIVENAGLDYEAIVNEYKEKQSLAPETATKLKEAVKKAGLPEEVVDAYFNNLKAQEELFANEVYSMVGGVDEFNAMAVWAQTNLPPDELKTFSDLAEKGDPAQAKMAIRLLHHQYKQAVQTGGRRIKASSGGSSVESDLIHSQKELATLMASPDYAKSPKYRREIQDRIARSVAAGVFKG